MNELRRSAAAALVIPLLAATAGCETHGTCIKKCMVRLEQDRGPVDACDLRAERAAPAWLRKCRLPEEREADKPKLLPCAQWVEACQTRWRATNRTICDEDCAAR